MGATEDLKRMICTELEEIAKKGEMSAGDLDTVYKLIVSKEKLLRIDELGMVQFCILPILCLVRF